MTEPDATERDDTEPDASDPDAIEPDDVEPDDTEADDIVTDSSDGATPFASDSAAIIARRSTVGSGWAAQGS
jgi:hypothetical protein